MHHYERMGAFAKAEDARYALLEAAPDDTEIVDWGIEFYERLHGIGDTALETGNLPRSELDTGLVELRAVRLSLGIKPHCRAAPASDSLANGHVTWSAGQDGRPQTSRF